MIDEDAAVDFIYIGAPRCGSTWLSAILDDHPDIFIPSSKEVHFFNDRMPYTFEYKYPLGIEHYRSYFRGAKRRQVKGDISPFTFRDPNAAWRIHLHVSEVKIICFLRDPVAMLFSLYLLLRQRERRAPTFSEEIARNPQLVDLGRYERMLQPFYDYFPAEQIHVRIYEELFLDREQTVRDIYRFVGVDPDFSSSSANCRFNVATDAPPNFLRRLRGVLVDAMNRPALRPLKHLLLRHGFKNVVRHGRTEDRGVAPERQGPEPAVRATIESLLAADLQRLQRRLGRSLSLWPTVPSQPQPARAQELLPMSERYQ